MCRRNTAVVQVCNNWVVSINTERSYFFHIRSSAKNFEMGGNFAHLRWLYSAFVFAKDAFENEQQQVCTQN